MAENIENMGGEQDESDEDLFDFPSDADYAEQMSLAATPEEPIVSADPSPSPELHTPSEPIDRGAGHDEDDDIFGFDVHDGIHSSVDDAGDLASGTRHLESLVDTDSIEAPPTAPAPIAATDNEQEFAATLDGSSQIDEDLFSFDNTDGLGSPAVPVEAATPPPEALTHGDILQKRDSDAEPAVQATPAPRDAAPPPVVPTPAPAVVPEAASVMGAGDLPTTSQAARQAADDALAVAQAARLAIMAQQPPAVPAEDRGWNRRMVISVAAAFLLVNASLIFIAGRLSQSLNSALDGVREDLNRSRPVTQGTGAPVPITQPADQIPATQTGSTSPDLIPAPESSPTALTGVAARELELAHKEIEESSFPSARRRLYRLLANRDRLIISADVLAEAEFLVAESYFAEAKRLDTLVVEAQQ